MIPINAPQIGEEEIKAVVKVLKSGILTHGLGAGPMVTQFEKNFAAFMKAKHAIAMNTGTGALHSTLAAVGIKRGDEVILPSFTFVATAEAIVITGAKPVFVDIDPETYNISPEKIEKAITKNTKAIMPVDLYGLPANMKPIREIADKHGLKIIEDAAQAHGASYKGKPPGAFADAACWSFYASKNMTTGEGGMVTTNNDEIAETLRYMRSHGEKEKYQSLMLGHNYHMPEIEAAIGCVQLKKLPKFVAQRRENARRLTEKLKKSKKLQLPKEPEGYKHSWYLYTVRMKNAKRKQRDKIVEELKQKGIGAIVCYMNPIHLMPYYRRLGKYRLPETEKAANQVFSLPVHPGVTKEQIDFIATTVLHLLG
ncbi:MAG: DegT/DnrJ/EryC1/StrS aminotransferase family protein [Candidatus Bathyarchaeota archaeon]|jgi:dTDP-4-amino-4,6-dideoxygalactose transaminase|nr:DegT/DnrJ/EryC1/StrS aminotransferase family protein [Candidatus Bathyarchaeota archaeon A05DMB-5]MDH7557373.1 DegT/DnrJ/EryC1/StrS aminotransferase family protein [Candidatus Bathyarchaeota archaeon]